MYSVSTSWRLFQKNRDTHGKAPQGGDCHLAREAWPNTLLFCWLPTSPHSSPQTYSLASCIQLQVTQPLYFCNSSSAYFFPQGVISEWSSSGTQILKESVTLSYCKITKKNHNLSLSNVALSLLIHICYYRQDFGETLSILLPTQTHTSNPIFPSPPQNSKYSIVKIKKKLLVFPRQITHLFIPVNVKG